MRVREERDGERERRGEGIERRGGRESGGGAENSGGEKEIEEKEYCQVHKLDIMFVG